MTDEPDADVEPVRDQPQSGGTPEGQAQNGVQTREEWKALAANPDIREDLGYEISEWEQFRQLDNSDQTMFMPSDEDMLRDEMFILANDSDLVTLENRR